MRFRFSRDTLHSAYAYLCETPPFSDWNLPDPDDVTFQVARTRQCFGWYTFDGIKHTIALSSSTIHNTSLLVTTMAHEMIHLHERVVGACLPGVEHTPAFHKWAGQVCRVHGFDPKEF